MESPVDVGNAHSTVRQLMFIRTVAVGMRGDLWCDTVVGDRQSPEGPRGVVSFLSSDNPLPVGPPAWMHARNRLAWHHKLLGLSVSIGWASTNFSLVTLAGHLHSV